MEGNYSSSTEETLRTARNASCGISTWPTRAQRHERPRKDFLRLPLGRAEHHQIYASTNVQKLWTLPSKSEIPGKIKRTSSGRELLRVSVIGCGHVGLVTGGCLAAIGHQVICADRDAERVHLLETGILPLYEPHLAELIQRSRASGLLMLTSDTGDAARSSDVIFLCVGVPQLA